MEVNHRNVDMVRTGGEVCIRVTAVGGEAPRLFGRHFDHTDLLVSKVKLGTQQLSGVTPAACLPPPICRSVASQLMRSRTTFERTC